MNQNIWARRLRPQSFEEVLGQDAVLSTLRYLLKKQSVHPALLLHGMRGVGKTSLARIIAKSLNCEQGVSPSPCQTCLSCQAIQRGEHVDVIELDAASRTKVEEIREWLETLPYAPVSARFKVFTLDEAHMLSRHSFNALLKILEEPPQHVQFIFATTEPHKLPDTVRSRTLSLALKPIGLPQLAAYLATILSQEGIDFQEGFCESVAQASQGSLRDALNLMEQAVAQAQGEGPALVAAVQPAHAVELPQKLWELWEQSDWQAGWKKMELDIHAFEEADRVLQGWVDILTSAYLQKSFQTLGYRPQAPSDFPVSMELFPQTLQFSLKGLWRMQQAVVAMRQDLPWVGSPLGALQLLWVRLSHFRSLEAGPSSGSSTSQPLPTNEGAPPCATPTPPLQPRSEQPELPAPKPPSMTPEALALAMCSQNLSGMAKSLLLQSQVEALSAPETQGGAWSLKLSTPSVFAAYQTAQAQKSLEQAALEVWKQPIVVRFETTDAPIKPLMEAWQAEVQQQREGLRNHLEQSNWKSAVAEHLQAQWVGFEK